jgi:hypothetical protein
MIAMESGLKAKESDLARTKRWASSAQNWDLARELDNYKDEHNSCQRQIGLLTVDSDQKNYHDLISRSELNQRRIDVIEQEISKRRGRF